MATDDFNRADGGLGADWSVIQGSISIVSNQAKSGSISDSAAMWQGAGGPFSAVNQYSQVLGVSTTNFWGPAVLMSSGPNYYAYYNNGTVQKCVAGTRTNLLNTTSFTNTDAARLIREGTWLIAVKNGAVVGAVQDASLSTGEPGFVFTNSTSAILDDWEGGELTGTTFARMSRLSENISQTSDTIAAIQMSRLSEAVSHTSDANANLLMTRLSVNISITPDPSGGGVVPPTTNFPQGIIPRNPKRFVKVRFKNGEEIAIADTTLRDSDNWHTGLKKAVLSYISNIEMEESRRGYRGKSCTIRILDKDNEWRQRASQRTMEGSYWTIYLVDDEIRWAEGEPFQIYGGHCVGHDLVNGFEFEVNCDDWLSRYTAEEDQPLMPPKMLRNSDLSWVPPSFEGKASPVGLGKLINGRGVMPNTYFGQSNLNVIFTGGINVGVDIHLFSELAMTKIARMTYTPVTWYTGSIVSEGDVYRPTTPNEHLYRATNDGITGSSEPTWPLGEAATVNDNGIIWEEYDDDDGTRRFEVPETSYGTDLIIPAHNGWSAATGLAPGINWVDYGTPPRRYGGLAFVRSTHRFAKALREQKMRMFMDAWAGNEFSDASGRYFSTPEDIIVFLLLNYLVHETDGITYAGNPLLDGVHGMVNMDSVEAAKAVGLLDVPSTGIVGAAYIGGEGTQKKVFNVIDDFLLGGRLGLSTNRFGQIELHRQNMAAAAVLKFRERDQHISFHAGPNRDDHKNRIEHYYGVNYGPIVETNPDDPDANKFESGLQLEENLDSQDETGRIKRFSLKNHVVREQASADAIAQAYLIQFTGPEEALDGPRDFHIVCPLVEGLGRIVNGTPIEIKIGTVLAITDREGYGVDGYEDKRGRVRKIIYNTEDGVTELFGRILEP